MAPFDQEDSLTLDPPGSIAVVGAGPLGIEAALYGRYLGYDVTLFESVAVGASMIGDQKSLLPMPPDRCLSRLANSALQAQRISGRAPGSGKDKTTIPKAMTVQQWIDNTLIPLAETDLLRNRLRVPARVTQIALVPIEPEDTDEDASEIPPDFQLTFLNDKQEARTASAEAVILATGASSQLPIKLDFELPTDYFFRVGNESTDDPEQDLLRGHQQIVTIYAGLAGRRDLDMHRPLDG